MPAYRAAPTPLAREIRAARLERGLTQLEMAQLVGVSHDVLARMEHGKSVSPQSAFRMARFLGIDQARFDEEAAA